MWVPYALGAIVVRLVGAKLPDRLGAQNIVAPSIALYALGMLTLTMVTSDTGFLIAATLCGIGHGYCFPVIASQVVGRSPLHQRGAAMALSTGIWEGSAIAAQPIFGAIADQHGDGWCFIAAASLCLVGICLWLLLESRRRS
jgi:fucose permease